MTTLTIASIDVGKRNFAQYVEIVKPSILTKLSKKYDELPKKEQHRVKGELTTNMHQILNTMYFHSEIIEMAVYDLTANDTDTLDIATRRNIIQHLELYVELWDKCDVFVVEQQFFNIYGGKKKAGCGANIDAIKIGELVLGWLMARYPPILDENNELQEQKQFIVFGSQFKTQILGAPFKLTKPQRKKWSVQKVAKIMQLRNDEERVEIFTKRGTKKDDMADAMLQCMAYKFRTYIGKF
jgi:hypothetical protein